MYIVTKATSQPDIGTALIQRVQWKRGMGCAPCGGKCGMGCCAGLCSGLGLFETGFDVSGWTWKEIGIVLLGGYVLLSTVMTTGRVARKVGQYPGEQRKRKAARLRAQAKELTKKR